MATIPYVSIIHSERLPIDAQDIVTKARIVVAGNRAGVEPRRVTARTDESVTYVPWPIVVSYEAPEHAALGAERSFSLPEGVNPFLAPTDPLIPEPVLVDGMSNPGSPSAIRDGDPITYAEFTASPGDTATLSYVGVEDACGFLLRYSLATSGSSVFSNELKTHVTLQLVPHPSFETVRYGFVSFGSHDQLPDADDPAEVYMVAPPLAQVAPENSPPVPITSFVGNCSLRVFDNTVECLVYHFYPLVLNRPLLEGIAQAQIRLPALNPQRITVAGYVAPDRSHTITGWPGGDFTGVVAQHQYELGRTVIDFEQAGAPAGLPAEAIEAARERTVAVNTAVSSAGYSVKMGQRQ